MEETRLTNRMYPPYNQRKHTSTIFFEKGVDSVAISYYNYIITFERDRT